MSAASIGPKAHTPLPQDEVMQGTLPSGMARHGWLPAREDLITQWGNSLQNSRPSPAKGILIGLALSALIWAAIIGFLLAL
jgi:hypothetical protein